jgi:hypothetical protein
VQLAKRLLLAYLRIGALLAVIAWGSFAWPLLFEAGAPLGQRLGTLLLVQPAALLSAAIRLPLWAPSLVAWGLSPVPHPFSLWLAPGLAMGPASRFYQR